MSIWHKPWFSHPYILATPNRRPEIFQTMTYLRSNNLSLKYQMSTPLGGTDIWIRKFGFVAKTQFLSFKRIVVNNYIFRASYDALDLFWMESLHFNCFNYLILLSNKIEISQVVSYSAFTDILGKYLFILILGDKNKKYSLKTS